MTPGARSWGIVGGGMLGLALAHRLRLAGDEVTVLEAAPAVGGLASAWRLGDVVWDRHYHVILQTDARLLALLDELGLTEELRWVETRTGCWAGGRLYSVSNAVELLRFPPLGLVDKFRLGVTVLYASRLRDGRRLESVLVADWLVRWSGRRVFDRFWLPLLRSKLGDTWRDTSAAFIWATIQRLYAARRQGLRTELLGYVRGGYARVLERFSEVLADEQVDVRTGQQVRAVRAADGGPVVELVDGEELAFDEVVVTAASPLAARLLPELADDERNRLDHVPYLGIVCASLLLRRPLAGFYVINITDDAPFTGVVEMTSLIDPAEVGGHTLVYLPQYVTADDPLLATPDEAVRERFMDGLRRMFADFVDDDVLAFRVSRVRHVLPVPVLGYADAAPPFRTSIPGVHVVSSAQIVDGTLNVNETLGLAERAFSELDRRPAAAQERGR